MGTSRVYRLRLARDWISRSGPRRHRRTTLVFVLRRPARVEFVVVQVSPACRRVGTFHVRGHRGVNRIRFDDRIGRHTLGPGTYRIIARRRGGGRVVDTRLVVVQNAKHANLRAARNANTCSPGTDLASLSAAGTDLDLGKHGRPQGRRTGGGQAREGVASQRSTAASWERGSRGRPSTPQEAFRSGSTAWRCSRSSCSPPGRSSRKRRPEGSPPRWSSG